MTLMSSSHPLRREWARSFIRGRVAAVLAVLAVSVSSMESRAAASGTPSVPAAYADLMQKLGAGALATGNGISEIPAAMNAGPRYTFAGATWEPVAVSGAGAATHGAPIAIDDASTAVVSITNAPRTADADALNSGVTLSGAHANTVGNLWAINRENLAVQPFDPGDEVTWSVTVSNLVEGRNRIGIFGEDAVGAVAGDGAMIWVGERYTSVPAIGIDGPAFRAYSNAITSVMLDGTNNMHVRGDAWWYNAKTWARGRIATGIVDAAEWTVAIDNLDVGRNPIYVMASNRYGDVALDLTTVIRHERADAARVVVTNWPAVILSSSGTQATISGTHSNLQGSMQWQVREQGTTGFFAPGQAGGWQLVVPVAPGTNTVVVHGRDAAGESDSDEVTILVGGPAYVTPAVLGITNARPTIIPFTLTSVDIGVTTRVDQVQSLVWTNHDDEIGGPMDLNAGQNGFVATVSELPVGPTYIDVFLVNELGNRAHDLLTIIRQPRPDLPLIEVTTAPPEVPFQMTEVNIGGTNNPYVVGPVAWSNMANGVRGAFPRQGLSWQGVVQPLAPGENVIVCSASNAWGDLTHDLASIDRGDDPSPPLVVITGEVPETIPYDIKDVQLVGSNSLSVSGPMRWVNADLFLTGVVERTSETSWSCLATDLQPGMNVIYVQGANAAGEMDTAVASIDRARNRGDARLWINTNGLPPVVDYTTEAVPLSGTNNEFVVGNIWWVNEAFAETGEVSRATLTWATDEVPLPVGVSVIYVYGANELGQVNSDVITIERLGPGGDPVVDITNAPPERLPYGIETFAVAGTNSPDVVGQLNWTNEATGATGSLPVPPGGQWSFEVAALRPGINNVVVRGADAYGEDDNDIISIFRAFPPTTRYVDLGGSGRPPYTNWTTAARSIQQAVDAASEGDLVLVGQGQYQVGSRTMSGEQTQTRLVVDRGVRVHSMAGPEATTIMGGWDQALNAVRGAQVSEGGELVGFTVREGRAETFLPGESGNGGGVLLSGGIVSNCWLVENVAVGLGGGVAAEAGGQVMDCVLRKNIANTGGGAALKTARLVSSLVVSNKASNGGGGIAAELATVQRCEILDNQAGPAGGARGGGLLAGPDTSVINSVLAGNTSTGVGGGALLSSNNVLAYCTVMDNESGTGGGGVFSFEEAAVIRSILVGNTTATGQEEQFGGPELVVGDSLLPFSHPANATGIPILADPERRNYRLLAGSPGIDLAVDVPPFNLADDIGPANDLDGLPRPLDGDGDGQPIPDAGAFEFLNVSADSDFDGLPDGWEWDHGLSPISSTGDDGASGDPDTDTLDNEGEYRADTDPGDPSSVLAIKAIDHAGGDVAVTVQGGILAGRALEARPVLAGTGTTWSVVDSRPSPTPVTNVLTHAGVTNRQFFYRVNAARE